VEDRSTPNKNSSCYSRTARLGVMPPFGNLYGVPTYVDKSLGREEYIVFQAGTHTDAINPAITSTRKSCSRASKTWQLRFSP